jgi:hypothetical protein
LEKKIVLYIHYGLFGSTKKEGRGEIFKEGRGERGEGDKI